jgi:hypothetical protein
VRKINIEGSQSAPTVRLLKTSFLLERPHAPAPNVIIIPEKKLNPTFLAIVLEDLLLLFIITIAITLRITPSPIVTLALSICGDSK